MHGTNVIGPALEFDRRVFLRMLGAAMVPVVARASVSERAHSGVAWSREPDPRGPSAAAAVPCAVHRAKRDQSIIDRAEQISLDPAFRPFLAVGDQCRIYRPNGDFALYTVAEFRNEAQEDQIRMGLAGRRRLGTSETFSGTLDTRVVTDGPGEAEVEAVGELSEHLVDDGASTSVVALAPHGGFIERYTDEQAALFRARLAGAGASSWICKGYRPGGGAYRRWHIPSTQISPRSFPRLGQISTRGYTYAVAFHGLRREQVIIGGAASHAVKVLVREAIEGVLEGTGIPVEVAGPREVCDGDSPRNLVNWLTVGGKGGIQIDQSLRAREVYGESIAAAVADVVARLVSLSR